MSEITRGTTTGANENEFRPNYLNYYKHLVRDLFSHNEDSISPFLGSDSDVYTGHCAGGEAQGTHSSDRGRKIDRCSGSGSYFSGGVGEGLSEFKKERLRAILSESAVCLNQEAEEVLDRILAMFQIESDVKKKELLPCDLGASDKDLCEPHHCRKRKTSSSISNNFGSKPHLVRQVYEEIQTLQGKEEICQGAVEKYSTELLAKLGKMETDLEEFLNMVVSKCRQMTVIEKHRLGRMIRGLPQRALDRVVEIIQLKNSSAGDLPDEICINLEEQDDATLWRLYYYVEVVAKGKQALTVGL